LLILFNMVTYFMPLLWALFVFKETNLNPLTLEVNNDHEGLLQLELMFFISWFVGVCLFVFVAFILKFKSLTRPDNEPNGEVNEEDNNYDIWTIKGADDFLHYLKFESF
jgi:hypothetical protein